MKYENLIFTTEENVATIKFDRPKSLNAINDSLLNELSELLDKIEFNENIRENVLRLWFNIWVCEKNGR